MKTHTVSATIQGQTLNLSENKSNRLQIRLSCPQNTSLQQYQAYFRYLKAEGFIPAQYNFNDILWGASRDYTRSASAYSNKQIPPLSRLREIAINMAVPSGILFNAIVIGVFIWLKVMH
jgi:hypothetical protein